MQARQSFLPHRLLLTQFAVELPLSTSTTSRRQREGSMKNFVLAGLVAAQMTVVAQPAAAAKFEQGASVQTGTFAGARVRISLGGNQPDRKFRAGLTLAPTLRSQSFS